MKLCISFALWVGWSTVALSLQCQTYNSEQLHKKVRYCVDRSHAESAPKDEPVIYFFHGMTGSSGDWKSKGYSAALAKLGKEPGFPSVSVVAFDTDSDSFFSDYEDRPTGPRSYETWLMKEFMQHVEKNHSVCSRRECRGAGGFSMGGFGALKTVLRHPDAFSAGAGSCPALPPFNAYEPTSQWKEYFSRHPIGSFKGFYLLDIIKNTFPTREIFDAHDPSVITEGFRDLKGYPAVYFDVGGRDDFGFQEGVDRYKQILIKKGLAFTSEYDAKAGHSIYKATAPNLIRFLSEKIKG